MNVEFTRLTINGYDGQPVPNQFLRQRDETTTLTVLLPGQGYTADMPLFYYSEWIALERGWDVLRVDYAYGNLPSDVSVEQRKVNFEERKHQLYADVNAAFAAGVQQRSYESVVLIGKSLGTRAMERLLSQGITHETWNVWLTPLINEPEMREQIERYPGRTLVAIGDKDHFYDREYLVELDANTGVELVVVEGADHSMDVSGDVFRSISELGRLMSRLDAFLPQ